MKLQLFTIPQEKLEAMAKRLRERISSKPTKKDETNLASINKELMYRGEVRAAGLKELSEIAPDDSHKEARKEEIELRTRLQLFNRESSEYKKLYHRWFVIREKGVSVGLYRFFTPEGGKRGHI
ncbi:MAG: hypothetical protein NT149_02475 [Candidatus Gottesmanbacteria bacterium]|nr:hypothetical protein [Candidatus Gottesmanbacteria bacterium]